MVAVAAMLMVRGGSVTTKVEEAAKPAAEEVCVGRVAAVQCIGGEGGGGDSTGIDEVEGKGNGDGSDVCHCGDVDCDGISNSNIDSNGGNGGNGSNGNSDGSSGVNGDSDACFHHG